MDPGLATTGWAVLTQVNGKNSLKTFGAIRTSAGTPLPERLFLLHEALDKIITEHNPEIMGVEELYFLKEAKSLGSLAQARGVILLTARKHGLQIHEYNPRLVKMAVTGYGSADKLQIQKMLCALLSLKEIPRPDDAADAMAIALCHLHSQRVAA